MKLEDLNAHLSIIRELEEAREGLAALEAATLTASRLDTMAHISGIADRTAALAIKISMQKDVVARCERIAAASSISVKAFIDSISDNRLNVILYLRFICGYEWAKTAEIVGANEQAIKNRVYRALNALQGE